MQPGRRHTRNINEKADEAFPESNGHDMGKCEGVTRPGRLLESGAD
jgi:hypothetical protein